MRSSFSEGKAAGYFGSGRKNNPYRKVFDLQFEMVAIDEYTSDWESGYVAGEIAVREAIARKGYLSMGEV